MKSVGGIIYPKSMTKVVTSADNVTVSWDWYDETNGIVEWMFINESSNQQTVILYRNGYYFGNAFWCVYEANPQFDVSWATSLTPLVDNGINNNSPPIGLVQFGSNQVIVAFLFTLAPHQEWSVLEGGFSASFPPIAPAVYQVSLISTGEYCIGYDQAQVSQWDQQTGTSYQGYEPNPSTFNTVLVQAPSNAIYTQLYPADTAIAGQCSGSPTNQCITEIEQGIQNANIIQIIDGILCLLSKYGIGIEDIIKRKIMKHI